MDKTPQKKKLVLQIFKCVDCGNENSFYRAKPQGGDIHNTDFRQFCFVCKKIVNHTRVIPKKT